ncbi:hypothetical protein [Bailinhaonella thermotolerans]|uniref:Alanine-rich protein n=1 Tax=Bailinhaonella thermotolerans TaxID=1070861 RepID=A0A3A4AWZ2_9ACTN|nr:hypothetical protein [Bailinhaonella thermotolerans]RJL30353.1 hypothetical protein D5H75_22495 [Bailinhaonella thermotolerans]
MDSSLYVFVEDLRGEGAAAVVDRAVGEYGVRGVTVGAAYHRTRDVTPHGARRVTPRRDGAHFPIPDGLFTGRLRPPVQPGAEGRPLDDARRETARRGAALHGWAVFLRNETLGEAHPDLTPEDCFGDRGAPADLCPANPPVREYAVDLARAVARQGVDTVAAEALHFGEFGAEACAVPLGPMDAFLFGLCFCEWCLRQAEDFGVDAAAARQECRRVVGAVLDGGPPAEGAVTRAALTAYAGPEVVAYARARTETVTSLVSEVTAAVRAEGARLVYLDPAGAAKGSADGAPTGPYAAHEAWRFGVDVVALGDIVPSYGVRAYARDPSRVGGDVSAYRRSLGAGTELRVVLRPGAPDTDSAEHLGAKVAAARAAGADAVDFYHYGLVPYAVLERIPEALVRQ